MEHLYPDFVAFAKSSMRLLNEADRETAFAVYKADDPSDSD